MGYYTGASFLFHSDHLFCVVPLNKFVSKSFNSNRSVFGCALCHLKFNSNEIFGMANSPNDKKKVTLSVCLHCRRLSIRNQANYKTMIHLKCRVHVVKLKFERNVLSIMSTGCWNSLPRLMPKVWTFSSKVFQFDGLHYTIFETNVNAYPVVSRYRWEMTLFDGTKTFEWQVNHTLKKDAVAFSVQPR